MNDHPAVRSRAPAATVKPSFKYSPRFGLILEVPSEAEQRREFKKLTRQGYRPRVVCV
jgi:hypothetical protein